MLPQFGAAINHRARSRPGHTSDATPLLLETLKGFKTNNVAPRGRLV